MWSSLSCLPCSRTAYWPFSSHCSRPRINIYLIIGFIWAHIYHLLERLIPHSFNIELAGEELFDRLVYLSFVTLTTLGYGDITPQGPAAEVLVMLEAIIGQMYVPVFVTYLLSVHIGQRGIGPTQDIM